MLSWQLYVFDLLLVVNVVLCVWLLPDLSLFSTMARQVSILWCTLSIVGGLGLYGVRIATYVAIARRCQMPQIVEWWVIIVSFALMAVFFLFGGAMLKAYGAAHGYRYCFADDVRGSNYVFVREARPCPPGPGGGS